jgi:hypothetical protein
VAAPQMHLSGEVTMTVVNTHISTGSSPALSTSISFQPLSSWQRRDCLFCSSPAIHEAIGSVGNCTVGIRCCDSEACGVKAAQYAANGLESAKNHLSNDQGLSP